MEVEEFLDGRVEYRTVRNECQRRDPFCGRSRGEMSGFSPTSAFGRGCDFILAVLRSPLFRMVANEDVRARATD